MVIGYDGRHRSREFAYDSARILAAAGFDAQLLPGLLPTPVLAFAVQHLGAVAGVMVTASHNPPQDNGYKVYAADGAQIVPPLDAEIEAQIRAVRSVRAVELSDDFTVLDESIVAAYVSAISQLVERSHAEPETQSPRALSIVHTAMHGVGSSVVRAGVRRRRLRRHRSRSPSKPNRIRTSPTVAFPEPGGTGCDGSCPGSGRCRQNQCRPDHRQRSGRRPVCGRARGSRPAGGCCVVARWACCWRIALYT